MFYIEDDAIHLTRGDDAVLEITRINAGSEVYKMQPGDTLTLTVRELPSADSPEILSVSGAPGGSRIPIRPADTMDARPGRYSADVQLVLADGRRFTVWPRLESSAAYRTKNYKNFVIMPEVTIP